VDGIDVENSKETANGTLTIPKGDLYKLSGIIGLAAFLRFFRIGQQSYWADEVQSIWQVDGHAGTILDNILTNPHGPLHFTLLWGWSKLGGWSEIWTRSLSAVAALVTIWFFYILARRLAGQRAALWAALLLAISPFHILYSQEVRNYALLVLFAVLSFIFLLRIIGSSVAGETQSSDSKGGLGTWIAFLFTSAAALACNLTAVFLFVSQGLYILIVRPKLFGKLVVILVLIFLLLLPWIKNIELGWNIEHIRYGDPLRAVNFHPFSIPYTFMVYSVGDTVGPSRNEMNRSLSFDMFKPFILYYAIACIVYVAMVIQGLRARYRQRKMFWLFATWLLLPIILAAILAILNLKVYQARYASVGFPAYLILLAAGIERCDKRLRWVLVVLIMVLTFVSLRNLYGNPRYWKPDARAAAAAIMEQDRAGDALILYTIEEPLLYYYDGPAVITALGFAPDSARFWDDISEIETRYERIWLVDYFGWYIDPEGKIPKAFDERFELADELRFTGIDVRLYDNPRRMQ
jgi:mannosyltransferase